MNNTAYQTLKKLFLMSLVLFAGAAIAQSNNNADLLGTHKPGVTSKPATTSTSEVKPVTTKNISTKPDATTPVAKSVQKTRIAPAQTAKSTTVASKANNGTLGGQRKQVDVNKQIAAIDAKLASNDPRLNAHARAKLQARRDALSKQITK
jgi:hypothetical protein